MCREICVDGKYIFSVREVKAAFEKPVWDDGAENLPDDNCICGLDTEATASANGYVIGYEQDDWECYYFYKMDGFYRLEGGE